MSINENEIEHKFVVNCFDSARGFESGSSTYREMLTIQEGSVSKKTCSNDDSYSLAKKEFLQISNEKEEHILL